MKIIGRIFVLLVFLALSGDSFAQLLNNPETTMPNSGIQVGDTPCFVEIEKVIRDNYGVDSLADLGEDGVKLLTDLGVIYNQLIAGTLSLNTKNVEFNTFKLEDWDNEIQDYKTVYVLEASYSFIKDGQEYQKRIAFHYEPAENNSGVKPISLSISEAAIDVMNPPIYYYFFEEDGVKFEEIW